jgi:predicted RNA methylase
LLLGMFGVNGFQPVNVAANPPQGFRVLHIDPEVTAAFSEVQHVVW